MQNQNATAPVTVAAVTAATPTPATVASGTLFYRRQHPGGGPLGRCSYGLPGVAGIVVFDMGLFAGGVAPATITVNCALAAPTARKVAGVTSAVVAAGNVAVTAAAGEQAIAQPAQVAAVAATTVGKLVGKATTARK